MSPNDTIRIAAAQYPIDFLATWENYAAKLERWVAEAATGGAELLVFPEYGGMELASLFPPAVHRDLQRQLPALQEVVSDVVALHSDLARRHSVHISAASLPVQGADGRYHNRVHLFAPTGDFAFQDKLVLTRFERELWGITPGKSGVRAFDTSLGRIGIAICYDVEFPLIARRQAEAGARLILAPSCTDGLAGYYRVRVGAQARALENQCFVILAPTVGSAPWSPAVDENVGAAGIYAPPDLGFPPTGVVAEGALSQPQWLFADLDMAAPDRVRHDGQVLNHRNWPRHLEQTASPAEIVALPAGEVEASPDQESVQAGMQKP